MSIITPPDQALIDKAKAVLLRCQVTEFEFKIARHILRGKKKKALCLERLSAWANDTAQLDGNGPDWKLHVHEALVKEVDAVLDGPGP